MADFRHSTSSPSIEPGLKLDDVCRVRNCSRRTGERERAAGLWPRPDFYVGTGRRKSPRWRPETILAWLDQQAQGRGARP
jgi:hypothetical protein